MADATRMLRFLSGLLTEVAKEPAAAAVEASAPMAETAVPLAKPTVSAEETAVFAEETATPAEETTAPVAETPASQPTDGKRNVSQQAARIDGDIQTEGNRYLVVQK